MSGYIYLSSNKNGNNCDISLHSILSSSIKCSFDPPAFCLNYVDDVKKSYSDVCLLFNEKFKTNNGIYYGDVNEMISIVTNLK